MTFYAFLCALTTTTNVEYITILTVKHQWSVLQCKFNEKKYSVIKNTHKYIKKDNLVLAK